MEKGDRVLGTGDRRRETGNRGRGTGGRRKETGKREQGTACQPPVYRSHSAGRKSPSRWDAGWETGKQNQNFLFLLLIIGHWSLVTCYLSLVTQGCGDCKTVYCGLLYHIQIAITGCITRKLFLENKFIAW